MEHFSTLLKNGTATIVDVRTPEEFMSGHVTGSINIPLHEIPGRVDEFRDLKNLVLCCKTGNRSGQAMLFLQQFGIECQNAGGWTEVNEMIING